MENTAQVKDFQAYKLAKQLEEMHLLLTGEKPSPYYQDIVNAQKDNAEVDVKVTKKPN